MERQFRNCLVYDVQTLVCDAPAALTTTASKQRSLCLSQNLHVLIRI